jgi:tRNA modification GTPase
MAFSDSIVALSSGRLPAGIAIIRISGPQTRFALETIAGSVPNPRTAAYRRMRDATGSPIDSGLVLFFPGPNSFTGEDCGELHTHGGKAVVAALLEALTELPRMRLADAGEFTRRAFLNGKLDLLEAEALADLISAETEAQRRLAVHNSDGAQGALYLEWRRRLIHARAMIEAELDFADESDVPGSVADTVWRDTRRLLDDIRAHISGYRKAEMIREGFDVVILGAPNAGKSSLLNTLARRDAAIVSDEPGTTRDLVELALDLDGAKVRLTDTAGIRSGAGKVEAIGIDRAKARAAMADLVLHLVDVEAPTDLSLDLPGVRLLTIGTKADLLANQDQAGGKDRFDFLVSSLTGEGIPELLAVIAKYATDATGNAGEVLPSRLRHVGLLQETATYLEAALDANDRGVELRADDLRLAADRLGRISGAVDVEDLLDVIFSEFCIGK